MKKQEGFTLIELMVVILIIGILVAIAVPVFFSAQSNAEQGACQDNLRTIDGAIMQYRAGASAYQMSTSAYVPTYLKQWPVCPTSDSAYTIVAGGAGEPPHGSCPNGHTY